MNRLRCQVELHCPFCRASFGVSYQGYWGNWKDVIDAWLYHLNPIERLKHQFWLKKHRLKRIQNGWR